MGLIELIGIILTLFGGYLLYAYITFRENQYKGIKTFFAVKKQNRALIYTVIIMMLAIIIGGYGRYMNGYSAVQCYLNIAMILLLAAMAWVDFKEKIIPNQLILVGLALWGVEVLLEIFLFHMDIKMVLLFSALGGGVWGGLLVLIALVVKTALGMGDAKMFFVIGLIYGLNNTYSILLVSLFIMAVVSIILLLLRKVNRKSSVPMAPFVLGGFALCIFLGM